MKPVITRIALWILAAEAALVALPGLLAPRYFYDSFPLGASWVDLLPPFNQHFITDIGGLYLAFALLFGWAAIRLQRQLVVPLCIAWAIAALLHFLYHVAHLEEFDATKAVAQTVSLAFVVALPLVAAAAAAHEPGCQATGEVDPRRPRVEKTSNPPRASSTAPVRRSGIARS